MKVLFIEDDRETIEAISIAIQMRWPDSDLVFTYLGGKGVELAESEAPDIILLDVGLRDMGSFEVLKAIRRFSAVPVIMLTPAIGEAYVITGLQLGANACMVMPCGYMEILALIEDTMRAEGLSAGELASLPSPIGLHPSKRQLTYEGKDT
jgi:DNA-binding response OmpR family regulator